MAEFEVFDDTRGFSDAIQELLDRDRVGATMLSAVLANQIAEPAPGIRPLLVCLTDIDGPFVAALRIPDFPLLVVTDPAVRNRRAALRRLAGALADTGEQIVGFHGRREVVRELADAWQEHTGIEPKPRMWSLFYRLGELVEPAEVPGGPRQVNADDPAEVALVAEWFARFRQETGVGRGTPVPDPEGLLRSVRRGEVITLWSLGTIPVSVAGHAPVSAGGTAKIAPVYTPPERRRQRFGAAATAAAVRSARALGAREVTLFTDEDYLPSNELYRSMGFEPIAEFAEFDVPPGPGRPAVRD
jgi:ribosomal protein S18 acetylase RimI-like enzyme